jgi:integrase/recombinase XerD
MPSPMIAPHVQAFFAEYLCQQRRLSPQTIVSCRDTFRLLLTFVRDQTGVEPAALRLADVDAPVVLRFLTYLEQERGNSVRSRNIRLSAIRSFFRLVALRDPDSLGIVTRVLAIPVKREDRKLIAYLTRTEMQALLAAPDRSKWSGRRDYALLLTPYNSGARVSEVTALKRAQVCFGVSTFVQLTGKGRKERTVPLWSDTARVVKAWFEELGEDAGPMAFPNARGKALSREGVDYLLQHARQRAIPTCPSLATKHLTPHVVRHYLPCLTMSCRATPTQLSAEMREPIATLSGLVSSAPDRGGSPPCRAGALQDVTTVGQGGSASTSGSATEFPELSVAQKTMSCNPMGLRVTRPSISEHVCRFLDMTRHSQEG